MGDSDYTASELRQRYHRGGSIPDDELSAKQLRARWGVPSNQKDFSTSDKDIQQTSPSLLVVIVIVAVLFVGGAILMFSKK